MNGIRKIIIRILINGRIVELPESEMLHPVLITPIVVPALVPPNIMTPPDELFSSCSIVDWF